MQAHTKASAWLVAPMSMALATTAHAQHNNELESTTSVQLSQGHTSVAFGVFTGRTMTGRRQIGGQVLLEIPLGRLVVPESRPIAAPPNTFSESTSPPPKHSSPKHSYRPKVIVKPSLARACVRAAWRAHGVSNMDLLDAMRSRARTSALLPEAKFRMSRDWDQTYRLTPTTDDPYRLQQSNGGGRTIEGRLTWNLDRLLFVDEELPMERLRLQRVQVRSKVAGEVLRALFDWQRARLVLNDPANDDVAYVDAVVREGEASAMLDVLTGGWFSSWLARGEGTDEARSKRNGNARR